MLVSGRVRIHVLRIHRDFWNLWLLRLGFAEDFFHDFWGGDFFSIYFGLSPFPVIVTTRIITFLVGNPYKPSFPLLLGRGTTQNILVT